MDINFLKKSLDPYLDEYGNTRIGFEHLLHVGVIRPEDESIDDEQCSDYFDVDYQKIKIVLDETKQVFTSNQETALVSFVISIGTIAFRSGYCFYNLKRGKFKDASQQFKSCILVKGEISEDLIIRRNREYDKFNE